MGTLRRSWEAVARRIWPASRRFELNDGEVMRFSCHARGSRGLFTQLQGDLKVTDQRVAFRRQWFPILSGPEAIDIPIADITLVYAPPVIPSFAMVIMRTRKGNYTLMPYSFNTLGIFFNGRLARALAEAIKDVARV